MSEGKQPEEIAIIGMAGRFPGAKSVDAFWANVRDGVESIRRLSDDELLAASVPRSKLSDPQYVKACPVLDDIDKFDASFFGFSPRDASVMDPAQRFFLEVAWQALEHAGYTGLPGESTVGVFAGSGAPLYMIENLRTNPELMRSMGEFLVRHTGNDMNFLATRVSYEMDLRGPSINVQTACSSALVSVHMACQSLLRGECNLALAGGSTILVPMGQGYDYHEGEILSPDGHCRPFDANSAGTVFGSGTGCVVLKRLKEALDDGDTIHAVIKGSALNNDGSHKVGYLAPSVDGQADVIDAALRAADVAAETISYVETHGTGTLVGDPIEVEALRQAFMRHTDKKQFCAIGSVKSNIGHLGEAAGIASLIKAVMALKHRTLPPSLGYESPNPQIDFLESPFFVNTKLSPWRAAGPLRCGVTALGAGGTNCHIVLEQPPEPIEGEGGRAQQLLVLSAKSRSALDQASENLAQQLGSGAVDLADVAYTLALGRRTMAHRRVLVASTAEQAARRLRERDPKLVLTAQHDGAAPKVVLLFPGGGAQYAGMGAELYECEEVYRDAIDECLALVEPALAAHGLLARDAGSSDLRTLMFAPLEQRAAATRTLERPSLTLPSLFATSYALAKLFQSWGVDPVAYVGHSMGEYVAALLAEVITLDEALRLVMLRGRLFEKVEAGGMLSVALPEADVRALMPAGLSIAAVNGPDLCVASGPIALIEALERTLATKEVESTRVRINVAAHSSMLDPILDEFRALCRTIAFRAPKVPFVSNLTGRWISAAEAMDPEYWVKHLRSTVRFGDCIETVLAAGERVLLEVGPGRTLSTLARAQRTSVRGSFNSMRHPQEAASDLGYALTTLGRLFLAGVEIDWPALYDGQLRNRIPLPTYPFEGKSFWVAPGTVRASAKGDLGKRENIDDWFATPTWTQKPLLSTRTESDGAEQTTRWLVFSDGSRLAKRLIERLGPSVLIATAGTAVKRVGERSFELDVHSSNQHHDLLDALVEADLRPDHVLYLLGAARSARPLRRRGSLRLRYEDLAHQLDESFFVPTFIARALGGLGEPVQLSVICSGIARIGDELLTPLHATCFGPVLVAPREFPQLGARCIDVVRDAFGGLSRRVEDELVRELVTASEERLVALRPAARWTQTINRLDLPATDDAAVGRDWLREGGVYVFTGGLGGIALEVAMHLAKQKRIKLALLGRSELAPEHEWDTILLRGHAGSRGAQRIQKVRALRELGAEVRVIACDVADYESTERALTRVRAELGPVTGVVHTAGVMDDEPMESRTVTSMQRVLEPKVRGTLVLDALLHERLDFFLLFSSVSSSLGLPGQVDYTAANAFLDAFARERSERAPGRTVVVNWNAWRDVGMAALSHQVQQRGPLPSTPCAHPALDGYSDDRATGRVFSTDFSSEHHWLLSEHQIKGSFALLSGTTFVELARAAFSVGRPAQPIEISDLTFLTPFQVRPGETRRLSIQLTPAGDAHEIVMRTAGSDARIAPHVIGDVRAYRGGAPGPVDLPAIAVRCQLREELPSDGFLNQSFVNFGPRWANLKRIRYGASEALIELALPERFSSDLEHYQLHPALLDMATGGAQPLIPGFDPHKDFYVPIGYGRVRVFAPMPPHVFSHVRCRPETAAGSAYFDVTLTDAEGRPFAEIARFEMKRIEAGSALISMQHAGPSAKSAAAAPSVLEGLLRDAIAPNEGVIALDRIMAQPHLVQCIASSVDLTAWQQQLDGSRHAVTGESPEAHGFSRPDLSSDYEAPATESERLLANIWAELLGVRQIGVGDDFFELGGNSLLAVRLFAAIKKRYGVSLPLSTLFEAPSIRPLAELLDANAPQRTEPAAAADSSQAGAATNGKSKGGSTYSSLVPMQVNGDRPPFYCAAGMGGNPLNLRALALLVGMDQPFFGLQPQGLDGNSPLHSSVTEMATYYISQIKQKQPHGPYYLGGYSGGGVIVFEMAKQLVDAGEEVGALVFIDSLAPVVPSRSRAERAQIHLTRLRDEGFGYVVETTARRLESELRSVTARLRRPVAKLFPYHFRLENIADTWLDAAARYRPGPYRGDAALFRASALSPLVSGTAIKLDEYNGWGAFVLGGVEVSACPGDHHNMCEQPNVRVLARRLRSYLDRRIAERSVSVSQRPAEPAAPREPERADVSAAREARDTSDAA
jgi:acyl transferase domain-containing protein/thioesterase domain-containing protein/NAD(P)-dependent dehydrogenase (short-subunit alcohol dehydrogenase family)